MEAEIQISTEEQETLLSEDTTPEVRKTYIHSRAYFQKQLLQKQKEDRAKERLGLAESRDRVTIHRQEHLALFEYSPGLVAIDIETMVSSARLFASLLRQSDYRNGIHVRFDNIQAGETGRSFCTRVYERWSRGVVIDNGFFAPHQYRFPLVNLGQENGDMTEAYFSLFYDWPVEGRVLSGEPTLPISWPEGSDAPLNLRSLPESLGEADRRAARKQLQDAQARRHEEPRTIVWVQDPVTKLMVPKAVFVRLSPREELLRYRLGYRYFRGEEFPELRPDQALADISIRARTEDLESLIEQNYARVTEDIQRRQ